MSAIPQRRVLALLALAALVAPSLSAPMVLRMDLAEMCDASGSIYRATVVSAEPGSVSVGGTELSTVEYTLEVTDPILGTFETKDGKSYATVRMLAPVKDQTDGDIRRFSKFPELPQLEVGGDYLLLTTTPSATGLSTTVGLAQGTFSIDSKDGMAVNGLGNRGLYEGPVAYDTLANDIRAALGQ